MSGSGRGFVTMHYGTVFELQGIKNLVLGLEEAASQGLLVSGEILFSSPIKSHIIKQSYH
jgi:hypothetical protein